MAEQAPVWLLRLLKVPPPPRIPEGNVRVFRAAPAYRSYRLCLWALRQVGLVAGLLVGALFVSAVVRRIDHPAAEVLGSIAEALACLGFLAQLPVGFIIARIDYAFSWYILTDRSLRLREGLVSIQEKTMTFANIQQVSLQQNPLQRLFGISDVKVETAGGGGSRSAASGHASQGEHLHEAYFRGMCNPEEIRDVILARVRMHRDSGLGEPQPVAAVPAASPAALDAARELLAETRALRQALPARQSPAPAE